MRTRTATLYYCDHCGKRRLRRHAMQAHEVHCTKNPARQCNVCKKLLEQDQPDIEALKAIAAESNFVGRMTDHDFITEEMQADVEAIMPKLREAAGNCPACIMAALRQSGIPVPCVQSFKFTDEMAQIFRDANDDGRSYY